MQRILYIAFIAIFAATITACEKDEFDNVPEQGIQKSLLQDNGPGKGDKARTRTTDDGSQGGSIDFEINDDGDDEGGRQSNDRRK
jgi:hypothetical protein